LSLRPTANKEAAMSQIRNGDGICTQITTVKLTPDNQDEVLRLMKERARFMASQLGFISVNLHRSKDGSHVVNYVQ
jgi:heme-degrading monooxygenase HmoA